MALYGDEPVEHRQFAKQICAEAWEVKRLPGKKEKAGFKVLSHSNHFLDVTACNVAAARMAGVKIIKDRPKQVVKISDMQKDYKKKGRK